MEENYTIAMEGMTIGRPEGLVDPKAVFDFLWSEFCLKAEKGPLPPVLFFVLPDYIELYDFGKFTESDASKKFLVTLVQERTQQEQNIEGVALCCEAFLRKVDPKTMSPEEIGRQPSDCADSVDAIILTFCWRGVEKTFMRTAEKTMVDGKPKLAIGQDSLSTSGTFTNFFGKPENPINSSCHSLLV